MIYFIHGFEWPYEKKNTVRINEYNQPDLKLNGEFPEKEIIFPEWEDLDSFFNACYRKEDDIDSIQIDQLIYKYKPSESSIVWYYGFVFIEEDEESFWENLRLTINKIIETNPNIKNINIPFALFHCVASLLDFNIFIKKLYRFFSEEEKIDFFINLENKAEIQHFYENFENREKDINFFDLDSQIISCLKIFEAKKNVSNISPNSSLLRKQEWKEDDGCQLYICSQDYKRFENETENILSKKEETIEKIKNEIDEYYSGRVNKNLRLSNYSRDIRNKVANYPHWIFSEYIPYKMVLKYSKILHINNNDKTYFGLFGYLPPPSNEFDGHIPNGVAKFLKTIQRENKMSAEDIEEMSEKWGNTLFSEKFTQENRAKLQKYSINRRELFFLVFEWDLKIDKAKELFELSVCQLNDSVLIEDKLLLCILKY